VVFGGTYLLPMLLLMLFKKSKLIKNFFLQSVEERKFPTVIFLGIAVSIGNLLYKVGVVNGLTVYFFGYAFALAAAYLFLMLRIRVSLHGIAIGGLTAFMVCLSHFYSLNLLILIAVLIGVGGLMMSARLYLKTHDVQEVSAGYLLGIGGQLLVYLVYNI